jgi:tripartite-type tricarboxylate transporter receptor subunit TctC
MSTPRGYRHLLLVAALQMLTLSVSYADPVESFFHGKTVTLDIGYSAGGGYDLYARLLARHLGKHIPGNPNVVPENMPGAGSLKAIAYLAKVAPRDGTVIGTFARGMPFYPLFFSPEFDATALGYIGSITKDTSVCLTWNTSRVKRWDDLFTGEANFGGEGKGADPDMFATLIAEEFGAKVKLVTGYPGTADITLALERGELDGLCGISYSTLTSAHQDWLKGKKINILVQIALDKDPSLPDVPSLLDLAKDAKQHQVTELAAAPQEMARPFAAPPDLPPERLAALRQAFDQTMTDPEFLADAAKSGLDVNPMTGAALNSLVTKLYGTPKDVVKEAARVMGN